MSCKGSSTLHYYRVVWLISSMKLNHFPVLIAGHNNNNRKVSPGEHKSLSTRRVRDSASKASRKPVRRSPVAWRLSTWTKISALISQREIKIPTRNCGLTKLFYCDVCANICCSLDAEHFHSAQQQNSRFYNTSFPDKLDYSGSHFTTMNQSSFEDLLSQLITVIRLIELT